VHTDSDIADSNEAVHKRVESASTDKSAADKAPGKASAKKPPTKSRKSPMVIFVLIFIVLITGASAAAAYYFWTEQQRHEALVKLQQSAARQQVSELSSLGEQLQQIKMSADSTASSATANTQQLQQQAEQLQQLNEQIKRTEAISQQAIAVVNRNLRGWALAEVDYLLRMAHQRIAVARDIAGAIAALKGADARLIQLADLRLFAIRKQLAKDISHLNAIHQVDISGVSLEIDQVVVYLSELPFKTAKDKIKKEIREAQARENPAPESGDEQTFVDSVWDTVKKISDLKVHQTNIEVATNTEQKRQIEQLLRMYLLSARLAVLRFDQQQFIYEISQASAILDKNYDGNDNRVMQLKKTLSDYIALKLSADLPELTKAWTMLQKEIKDNGSGAQLRLSDNPSKKQKKQQEKHTGRPVEKAAKKKQSGVVE